jgi:hypothetical protein
MKVVRYITSVAGSKDGKSYNFAPKDLDSLPDARAAAYEKAGICEIVNAKDLTEIEKGLAKEIKEAAKITKEAAEKKAKK